jgi:prepilin-type N-terminal cleavage/methylation domain-containing protein
MIGPRRPRLRLAVDGSHAARPGGDTGTTLIEMMVAMAVMSVVMVIFTAGIVSMYRAERFTTAVGDAQAQLGRAFLRLDSELRYAADLRTGTLPASPSAYPSLLYLSTVDGARCYALSLGGDRLLRQEWLPGMNPGPAAVLAFGVAPLDGVVPFAVTGGSTATAGDDETSSPTMPKEATITLSAAAGGPAASNRRELRETFLAPNSVRGPQGASLNDCVQ